MEALLNIVATFQTSDPVHFGAPDIIRDHFKQVFILRAGFEIVAIYNLSIERISLTIQSIALILTTRFLSKDNDRVRPTFNLKIPLFDMLLTS